MAPLARYMPLPYLDLAYTAVNTSNATFDSPDWDWQGDVFDGAWVSYTCEAILILVIFALCYFDHRNFQAFHETQLHLQSRVYAAAVSREFADWRAEWEPKFPNLFLDHAICTICLDPIGDREMIRGLPCLHVFHRDCMDVWFEAFHVTCPLCKQDILKLHGPCYRAGLGEV